jgi:hypothetical protein
MASLRVIIELLIIFIITIVFIKISFWTIDNKSKKNGRK